MPPSAQLVRPNPYDQRYALPPVAYAESPGNNAMFTRWRPRRSYDDAPAGWDGGYALPAYVKDERPGAGARYTHWTARTTIPQHLPSAMGSIERMSAIPPDPIKIYGQNVARSLMTSLRREVPATVRPQALEALLDHIDPGLARKVSARTSQYEREFAMPPARALEVAIASAMSEGLLNEVGQLGRGVRPQKQSQIGLGWYDDGVESSLAGWWSSAKKAVSKAGSAVKGAAIKAGRGVKYAAVKTGKGVKYAAVKTYGWGKKGIKTIGKYACKAIGSDAFKMAASAGGAAAGIPPQATSTGVDVAGGICPGSKSATPAQEVVSPPPPSMSWLPIAAIAGAGVVLLALR